MTHNDAPQSVGLLWTSDQLVAETSIWQHKTQQKDIHAPGGIRTHNLSQQTTADLALDRAATGIGIFNITISKKEEEYFRFKLTLDELAYLVSYNKETCLFLI